MTAFLDSEGFNVAHPTRRHPPLSWALLGLSALLCALSLYPLRLSLTALDAAEVRQRQFNQMSKRQAEGLRKAKLLQNSPPMMERDKAQRQIQDFVHMSWDGIFDALEVAVDAVRSGVSIVALVPTKVQPSSIELTITGLASNAPIMLTYLKALQSDPRILQVQLENQQPDEKSGPGVVRFQFNLVCNPQVSVAHPLRPPLTPLPPAPANAPTMAARSPNAIVPPAVLNNATTPGLVPVRKP